MTGTTDMSRAQWDAIQRSIGETDDGVSGLRVSRVVVTPDTSDCDGRVRVTFHVLGYGTVRWEVEKDGKRVPLR